MGFASIRDFFAQAALVTPDQFEDWNKAWRVAVESGSQEPLLAFICRERGVAEDVFLQQLAKALGWPYLDLPKLDVPPEARKKSPPRSLSNIPSCPHGLKTANCRWPSAIRSTRR